MFTQLAAPLVTLAVFSQTKPAEKVDKLTWPRAYEKDGHEVVVYDPQVESWEAHKKLAARAAIALTTKGAKEPVYGALDMTVETEISMETRQVLLKNRKVASIRFPNVDAKKARDLESTVREVLGQRQSWIVPLDLVMAYLESSKDRSGAVEVGLAPPPIFYSETPGILVIFLGKPRFESIKGTKLFFATNTNWDVLYDATGKQYYLLNGDHWLTTPAVEKGPWTAANTLPADLFRLPKDKNWEDVRKNLPGKSVPAPPKVFVTAEPAELILTQGPPKYRGIPGTMLSEVTNTTSDLFRHSDGKYYFLTAGRWFRASRLGGPWASATKDLPDDFRKIPENDPAAVVRVSVPGTQEAEDAILLASIPRKATIDPKTVKVTVVYEGEPQFVVVEGTTIYYAVNSPYDVFRVEGKYYCCHKGVWFVSSAASGPWVVCTSVPKVIYTIPSTHPKHNVTYVYVYDSTPTTVVVGHTAGYTGAYVAATGVLMFGLGWALGHDHDHHHHYHHHSHYYGYGCAARYDYHHGTYYRSAHAYGPYGGAGRGAAYNPSTGAYARGAYAYGPSGSRYAAQAYNPYTDTYAARRGGSNAYGSWGQGVVTHGDEWVRGGYRSDSRGTVGGIETSKGGAVVGARDKYGNSGFVGKDRYGDVYVGKDGNIYKRESNGSWQKRENGSWNSYDARATTTTKSGTRTTRSGSGTRTTKGGAGTTSTNRSSVNRGLQRDSISRSRGSRSASRASRYGSSSRFGSRSRSRSGAAWGRGGGGRRR